VIYSTPFFPSGGTSCKSLSNFSLRPRTPRKLTEGIVRFPIRDSSSGARSTVTRTQLRQETTQGSIDNRFIPFAENYSRRTSSAPKVISWNG